MFSSFFKCFLSTDQKIEYSVITSMIFCESSRFNLSTECIHLKLLKISICIVLDRETKKNSNKITDITFEVNKFLERWVKLKNLRLYIKSSVSFFLKFSADFEEAGAISLTATIWKSVRETLELAVLNKVLISVKKTSDKKILADVFLLKVSDWKREIKALVTVTVFETAWAKATWD